VAQLLALPTFCDARGCLSVADGVLPFPVRRAYVVYGVPKETSRAGHRHRRNRQVLVCVAGQCRVHTHDGAREAIYTLETPTEALLLDASDWHSIDSFSEGAVLLVLASEPYDPSDYIDEPYP
jgi:hypothetical protein